MTVMRDKHRVFALTNGKSLRFGDDLGGVVVGFGCDRRKAFRLELRLGFGDWNRQQYDKITFGISVTPYLAPSSYSWGNDVYGNGASAVFTGPTYQPMGFTYGLDQISRLDVRDVCGCSPRTRQRTAAARDPAPTADLRADRRRGQHGTGCHHR